MKKKIEMGYGTVRAAFVLIPILLVFLTSGCIYPALRGAGASNATATGGALDSAQDGNLSQERIVTFTVTGKGLMPETAINTGQGRLMAERAAINDGYRQLVEKIRGVYIDAFSQTTNGIVDYDVIRTKTQSWLRGVEIIAIKESGYGIFNADMQLRIYFTQNDMIWWPTGLGSHIVPAPTKPVKYYFARPSILNMFRCESYPWCGEYYYTSR
ncbi:conserved hypothetical protein [Desulfamplus magnetovallimortis]|uniref:Lipoprotein LPP20-like domain-containing protein n=1 Tax=Desulfamplus magnetovallimortis TaxID=1246637 RepID=A0A1W1HKM4_9BACT|nr:LPP20 family lipoprotein [Desulfamplus magnetovallimortis]SLM32986.1 conserved hypothetical protein [Desulfamplus magnetovallimortis]